jgi:hypothetical protein
MNVNKNIDILLYFLWQEGQYTNLQIGALLGLTHSSVCRRVAIMRKRLAGEGAPIRGEYLYGDMALELSSSALKAGGVFAVWSEDPDKALEKRLKAARFSVNRQRPGRGGRRHVVYIARKTSGAQAGGSGKTGPTGRKPHKNRSR